MMGPTTEHCNFSQLDVKFRILDDIQIFRNRKAKMQKLTTTKYSTLPGLLT